MILVDTNIFMYAGGAAHPHKEPSLELLARIAAGHVKAAVDVEVLQEILHRYRSLGRWADGRKMFDLVRRIMPMPLAVTALTLDNACALMEKYPRLEARDALHAAACTEASAEALCSYDRDFDVIAGFTRIEPGEAR